MGFAVMGKNMRTFPPQLQNQLEITGNVFMILKQIFLSKIHFNY
jgi:hypothetical protein